MPKLFQRLRFGPRQTWGRKDITEPGGIGYVVLAAIYRCGLRRILRIGVCISVATWRRRSPDTFKGPRLQGNARRETKYPKMIVTVEAMRLRGSIPILRN